MEVATKQNKKKKHQQQQNNKGIQIKPSTYQVERDEKNEIERWMDGWICNMWERGEVEWEREKGLKKNAAKTYSFFCYDVFHFKSQATFSSYKPFASVQTVTNALWHNMYKNQN